MKLKTFCSKTHDKNSIECAKKFYYKPSLYAWNRGAKIQYANYNEIVLGKHECSIFIMIADMRAVFITKKNMIYDEK